MTDNEIIRALECHENLSANRNACERCPILNHWDCGGKMASNALSLIKRQKAEIERLKEDNEALNSAVNSALDIVNSNYLIGRTDGIKEFAEKLKECKCSYDLPDYHCFDAVEIEDIDNLVKEMVGEEAVDEATAYKEWERANVGEE